MRNNLFLAVLFLLLLLLCSCSDTLSDPMLEDDTQRCNNCYERAIKEMERCKLVNEHFRMECPHMSQNLTE